jgi:hypothetical protein
VIEADADFVDHGGRKEVSFREVEETAAHRQGVREVEVGSRDAAAERSLQAARAERLKGFRIGIEEAERNFVATTVEFALPVGGELIVGEFTGRTKAESAKAGAVVGDAGNQVAVGSATKLVAFEVEERERHGIETSHAARQTARKEVGDERIFRTVERNRRDARANDGTGRIAAALASALVVDEEEAGFFRADGPAETAAEDVLLENGARLAAGVEEVFVGVENVIAEKLVSVAVELARTGLENGVDVAAAVAALSGVVERGLNLELLDDVRDWAKAYW